MWVSNYWVHRMPDTRPAKKSALLDASKLEIWHEREFGSPRGRK